MKQHCTHGSALSKHGRIMAAINVFFSVDDRKSSVNAI